LVNVTLDTQPGLLAAAAPGAASPAASAALAITMPFNIESALLCPGVAGFVGC
jgi:hypothetical protein